MDRGVYARMDELEATHWWFAARREIIGTTIRRMIRLPKSPRILEAGCGTGGNLEMLMQLGRIEAFEYDEAARLVAARKSGLTIHPGALPDGIAEVGSDYDLIALFDVLEHIDADSASLKALSDRLAQDGRILVTVPAFGWMWSRHDERHHHFRRYTKASLRKAASAAGLEVEHTFYFNSLLFPVAVAARALKTLLGRDTPDDSLPASWLNRALYRVFRAERHAVGRLSLPAGLSLCAVIRRRPA